MVAEATINPANAGTVSIEITGSGPGSSSWTGWWTRYKITAHPYDGFSFSYFDVYHTYTTPSEGTTTYKDTIATSPYGGGDSPDFSKYSISEFEAYYSDGRYYEHKITRIVANFIGETPTGKILYGASGEILFGSSGTILYDD